MKVQKDRCPDCEGTGLIGGAGINDRCDTCNGTGKLDSPEREKIARAFYVFNKWSGGELHSWDDCNQSLYYSEADQIIALFPSIEEAKHEERGELFLWGDDVCRNKSHHPDFDCMLRHCCLDCWQALKGAF